MPDDCPNLLDCCIPDPFAFGKCDGVVLETRIDPVGSGSATGAGRYDPGDSATVCASTSVPIVPAVGLDFVFVVDESASMSELSEIMASVVTGIESRLNAAGIGDDTVPNRYAVVAFGMGIPSEIEIPFQRYATFLAESAGVGPRNLGLLGEDAYEGINVAITQLPWRETSTVSKLLFFITDEDRNDHYYVDGADQAAQFITLKAKLVDGGFLLAGMTQSSLFGLNNGDSSHPIIGGDYTLNPVLQGDGSELSLTGQSYYADGFGGYLDTVGVNTLTPSWRGDSGAFPTGVQADYFDLLMDQDVKGYWFDLFLYRQSSLFIASINALIVPAIASRIAQELTSTFVGWYDLLGNLLTDEACYTFTIRSDTVLIARFVFE